MAKLVHIVLESTNKYILGDRRIDGLFYSEFDTRGGLPSTNALHAMTTGLTDKQRVIRFSKVPMIMQAPLRVYASHWPVHSWPVEVSRDELRREHKNSVVIRGDEPNSPAWAQFIQEISEPGPYWHLFWTTRGHHPIKKETAKETLEPILDSIESDIMPILAADDILLIHPDHGIKTPGQTDSESLWDGFMFSNVDLNLANYGELHAYLFALLADKMEDVG